MHGKGLKGSSYLKEYIKMAYLAIFPYMRLIYSLFYAWELRNLSDWDTLNLNYFGVLGFSV